MFPAVVRQRHLCDASLARYVREYSWRCCERRYPLILFKGWFPSSSRFPPKTDVSFLLQNPLGVRANHNNNHPPAPNASDGNFNSYGFAPPTNRRPSESVFGAGPPVDYQLRGSSNTSLPPPSNSSSSNSLYRSGAAALPPPSSAIPFATTFSPFGNSNYDH